MIITWYRLNAVYNWDGECSSPVQNESGGIYNEKLKKEIESETKDENLKSLELWFYYHDEETAKNGSDTKSICIKKYK